ncbi:rhoGAP domain-containing protein [Ditylenchus destructor]|nr:rhoGAP domain-containing protein [Ditylenchus destructor]
MSVRSAVASSCAAASSSFDDLHFISHLSSDYAINDQLDLLDMAVDKGDDMELGTVNHAFEDNDTAYNGGNTTAECLQALDDEHVYANVAEIARRDQIDDIDRRPYPPFPNDNMVPIRTLPSGWQEYKTLGGRSYYFHPEERICQWKPPRNSQNKNLMGVSMHSSHYQSASDDHCEPSTSSTELFTELPLRSEYNFTRASTDSIDAYPHQLSSQKSAESAIESGTTTFTSDGMTHSTISYKNYDSSKPPPLPSIPPQPEMQDNGKARTVPNANTRFNHLEESVISALSHNRFAATAIRQGTLEKCKLMEHGIKAKKKEWTNSYAYLYSSHLLFYKDQKSAEKTGKHYPAPTDVCELRGAILTYTDKEKQKDKHRKHVISLSLPATKTEYLFSCAGNEAEINSWFHTLRQTISALPPAQSNSISANGSLQRSTSTSSTRNKMLGSNVKPSQFSSKSSLQHSVKKSKVSVTKDDISGPSNVLDLGSKGDQKSDHNKETIIERLQRLEGFFLRFFRSRPTMSELRERGIYKPEPVFGSTLAAISQHDHTFIPKFISEVTRLIEHKGLDMDGLYRVNGNLSSVQKIRCQIDQDKYDALYTEDDVHVLTGSLKLFFRELSEPIFPFNMNKEFMSAIREPNSKQRFKTIDELLTRLPTVNKETLKCLMCHLERQDKGRGGRRKLGEKKSSTDETAAPPTEPNQNLAYKMMLEDFVIFGRGQADPWNRINCGSHNPIFLFIEFCQIQGPKPLLWYPENPSPNLGHLDLDQVAIWVMSSENVHGSFSCIFNQNLGLYTLVQHSTLFDITARAFQRPFALALLTPNPPTTAMINDFQDRCIKLFKPILACNREHFVNMLRHCLYTTEQNEESPNEQHSKLKRPLSRLKSVSQQAKPWYARFLESYRLMSGVAGERCECGAQSSDFAKFAPLFEHYASTELIPLLELAPCGSVNFRQHLHDMYNAFVDNAKPKGILFSNNQPVLRSFFGANSMLGDEEYEEYDSETTQGRSPKENSLKDLSLTLSQCLFPLLAGDKIAILASKQRECTGRHLLGNLNSLRICKRNETAPWRSNADTSEFPTDKQLCGFSCAKNQLPEWNNTEISTIIDLNHQRITGREYAGRMLSDLNSIRQFPSDKCLRLYIAAVITDIMQWVLLAKYTNLNRVSNELKMSVCDQLILINCLLEMNVTKHSPLKKRADEMSKNVPFKTMRL